MNEHSLVVEYIETKNGNFHKVTCPDGHFITSWNSEDDIRQFNASKIVCCPLKVDIEATYRCITQEEYLDLFTKYNDAIAADMEQRKNEMNENQN